MHESPVRIKAFPTRHEAMIAQGLLSTYKITSYVSADDAGGAYPFSTANAIGVQLLVKSSDATKALQLLKNI